MISFGMLNLLLAQARDHLSLSNDKYMVCREKGFFVSLLGSTAVSYKLLSYPLFGRLPKSSIQHIYGIRFIVYI